MKTTKLLLLFATLCVACVCQLKSQTLEYDVIYVRSGMGMLDYNSTSAAAQLVIDLNTGAPAGVHYNLQIVNGYDELQYLVSTSGRVSFAYAHGEYVNNSFTGNLRTLFDGVRSEYDFQELSLTMFYCGMVTLYNTSTGEAGSIYFSEGGNNIIAQNGFGSYTNTWNVGTGGWLGFDWETDEWSFESDYCPEGWHQVTAELCCPDGYNYDPGQQTCVES